MRIEVKKRMYICNDVDCMSFAYGIAKTPYSEEIMECENNIPLVVWEHAYIMCVMRNMLRFPNSTIECRRDMSNGEWNTTYDVTEYAVSATNDDGVECAVHVSPFKSLLQLNGCKTNRLIESLLFVKYGDVKGTHYTVDKDGVISVKFNTIKMMYSVSDVASMIGVTSRTLYNWVFSKLVKYHRTEHNKIYFTSDDIETLQKDILLGTIQLKHRGKQNKKEEKKDE